MDFKEISPFEIHNNFFKAFDKDWALLCAGSPNVETESNMMTVSWGGIGILWNKPIAVCYIRPQRYTLDFVNKTGRFSLNFFLPWAHIRRFLQVFQQDVCSRIFFAVSLSGRFR